MNKNLKILVVVGADYDNLAMIGEVSAIAVPTNAQVTLIGTRDLPPNDPDLMVATSKLDRWITNVQLDNLEASRAELEQVGIATTIQQATSGKAYQEIISVAVRDNYDLIMKPAANQNDKLMALFSNRDLQLFRLSQTPVWIFKPTPANKLAKIMVAVDPVAYDKDKNALAEKVLNWGKYVAESTGAELHILHSWNLYREDALSQNFDADTVNNLLYSTEQKHSQWLKEAVARSGIDARNTTLHFQKGNAEDTIPAAAQEHEIDLLVMGTAGRTGIPGFLIGNTADSVLRQATCSVLAIKPDGFETPLKV